MHISLKKYENWKHFSLVFSLFLVHQIIVLWMWINWNLMSEAQDLSFEDLESLRNMKLWCKQLTRLEKDLYPFQALDKHKRMVSEMFLGNTKSGSAASKCFFLSWFVRTGMFPKCLVLGVILTPYFPLIGLHLWMFSWINQSNRLASFLISWYLIGSKAVEGLGTM